MPGSMELARLVKSARIISLKKQLKGFSMSQHVLKLLRGLMLVLEVYGYC